MSGMTSGIWKNLGVYALSTKCGPMMGKDTTDIGRRGMYKLGKGYGDTLVGTGACCLMFTKGQADLQWLTQNAGSLLSSLLRSQHLH